MILHSGFPSGTTKRKPLKISKLQLIFNGLFVYVRLIYAFLSPQNWAQAEIPVHLLNPGEWNVKNLGV